MIFSDSVFKSLKGLFPKILSKDSEYSIELLLGGGNNKIFLIKTGIYRYILKQYFQHKDDPRNRLQNEYQFLQYASEEQVACIPAPIEINESENLGLYTFIEGRKADLSDVKAESLSAVTRFFQAINRNKEKALHLPHASEACFSYRNYVELIEKRIARFKDFYSETSLDRDVLKFLQQTFFPLWAKLQEELYKKGLLVDQEISLSQRCITPSDFGFHNILINQDKVHFVDFEYAGWDDPAKTICDFFLQPKVPVSLQFYDRIAEEMACVASEPEECLQRAKVIFPFCQLKWCLILLNSFSQIGRTRRRFSYSQEMQEQENQFLKAKELLNNITI